MNNNIVNFPCEKDEISDVINQRIREGKLKGIVVIMMSSDDTFETRWDKSLRYLDVIGMVETAKQDIYMRTNGFI